MAVQSFRRALFAAMLISATVATLELPRTRRRAPITRVDPITLEELHYTCSVQGWTQCSQMVSSLLDGTHDINQFLSRCHAQHHPYEQTTSPPTPTASLIYSNIGDSANVSEAQPSSGSGEHNTSELSSQPTTAAVTVPKEELKCTVSGAEKKRIRKNVYCAQLFDLDERLRSLIPLMCLLRDFGCVPYFADPGYLTPNQIMESIQLWHQDMIDTHKKCCESRDSSQNSSRIFSRDLPDLYGNRIDFRIGEVLNSCPFGHAGSQWVSGLSEVALLVHMLDLMQGLGRRRMCLRGCVSEGQVLCTNLLPYVL